MANKTPDRRQGSGIARPDSRKSSGASRHSWNMGKALRQGLGVRTKLVAYSFKTILSPHAFVTSSSRPSGVCLPTHYSNRSASTGSILAARRAGNQHASNATAASNTGMIVNVSGSAELTP